ncbi:hypothetical protein [Succinivibrio dextrinosolvens]|uniref:hypothetical protein n=1 Tax=Succinivibrio dextrinosolvens TaxID=83771 RepID=UPI0004E15880|nr:hypothetical protein [Succinivibrio dextrinosolvens]
MFTEEELNQSILELNEIEEELKRLDALYNSVKEQLPKDVANMDTRELPHDAVLDKMIDEAKRKAEAEGRQRAAIYEDKIRQKKGGSAAKPKAGSRRGMMA